MIAQTAIQSNRRYGLIIDITGGTALSQVVFQSNKVRDIMYFYKQFDKQVSKWNHCDLIYKEQYNQLTPVWGNQSNQYAQYPHLIAIKDHLNMTISISDNTFFNLSLPSSLMYLNETEESYGSDVVLSNNTFELIVPYIGVGILEIMKTYNQYQNLTITHQDSYEVLLSSIQNAKFLLLKHARRSGRILFEQNYFHDIAGCKAVHTTLTQISILDSSNKAIQDSLQGEYKLEKFDQVSKSSNYMQKFIEDKSDFIKIYDQEVYFFSKLVEQDSEYSIKIGSKSFQLKPFSVQFNQNTYKRLSVGSSNQLPSQYFDSSIHQGSVLKLYNLFSVGFIGEIYEQVGTLSQELLNFLIYRIKNEVTFSYEIQEIISLFQYSGSSLIDVYMLGTFRMLGKNTFTNIWITFPFNYDQFPSNNAQILYTKYLYGYLAFGGQKDELPQSFESILIKNIGGPLNSLNFNDDPFRKWEPSKWSYSQFTDVGASDDNPPFGIYSTLINLHDSTNNIIEISFQNVQITNISTRVTYWSKSAKQPMIISTNAVTNYQRRLTLKNLILNNLTFERGGAIFELNSVHIEISNVTILNLGGYQIQKELYPDWVPYIFYYNGYADFPIFKVNYFYPNFEVKQLTVKNVLPYFGVPVFKFNFDARNLGTQNITIKNSTFENIQAANSLSTIIEIQKEHEQLCNVFIEDCTFRNLSSSQGIYSRTLQNQVFVDVKIERSRFFDNRGVAAQHLYISDFLSDMLTLKSSYMSGKQRNPEEIVEAQLSENLQLYQEPSLIYVRRSKNVIISDLIVEDAHYSSKGGFINIQEDSEVDISNSLVNRISSYDSGAITISRNSKITIAYSTFQYISAVKTGVISSRDNCVVIIQSSAFINNTAIFEGVFKFSDFTRFYLYDNLFFGNRAEKRNSIGLITSGHRSTLLSCKFVQNTAFLTEQSLGFGGLEIIAQHEQIDITGCEFTDNEAIRTASTIQIVQATIVVITQCLFQNTPELQDRLIKGYDTNLKGAFLHVESGSNIEVVSSVFARGYALDGGAIYLISDSSAIIKLSKFERNIASRRGGAIFGESFSDLYLGVNTQLLNNLALREGGDAIFVMTSTGTFKLSHTAFRSLSPSNFIETSEVDLVSIVNSAIVVDSKNDVDLENLKKGGIYISECKDFLMLQSHLENLTCSLSNCGGGLTIVENSPYNNNSYAIIGTNFTNCTSLSGGAAVFVDTKSVLINGSTEFRENLAHFSGGAIDFSCNKNGRLARECTLEIENAMFIGNSALMAGGGISWNYYEPLFRSITHQDNYARLYGNILAGVTKRLIRVSNEHQLTNKTFENELLLLEQSQLENVKSGGGSESLYFAVVDKYGQVVRTDNSSILSIRVEQNVLASMPFLIETDQEYRCQMGLFVIENIVLVGQPNSTSSKQTDNQPYLALIFQTDAIDESIPDNRDSKSGNLHNTHALQVQLRRCFEGEQMLPNGKCVQCPQGTYLLFAPDGVTSCKTCSTTIEAECLGGDQIYPMPGYWRSSFMSDNMLQCRNKEACLGRNPPENNPLGACNIGYQGILCQQCTPGYSQSGSNFKCSKCMNPHLNGFRIFSMLLFLAAVLVFLIRSNIQRGKTSNQNYTSVLLRIIMNHFQLLSITASFNLEWPQQLQTFFKNSMPISEVSTQFLSIDCFLQTHSEHQDEGITLTRVNFVRLIFLSVSPVAIFLCCYLAWQVIFKVKSYLNNRPVHRNTLYLASVAIGPDKQIGSNNRQSLDDQESKISGKNGRIVASFIIILFLLHPTLTSMMFSIFNCQNIDGTQRLYDDLQVECFSPVHTLIAFGVGLPSLIVWSLGVPTLGTYLVYKQRRDLNSQQVIQRYGFLYNGYRLPQAYYWEFVIMYRKIIIIFIQVFLVQTGHMVQALVTLAFLIVFLALTVTIRPFIRTKLNTLETLSLITSGITVYCGLFYLSDAYFKEGNQFHLTESTKLALFSAILISHVIFFGRWVSVFIEEIRAGVKQRLPKLYVSLFLCCSQKKLNQEVEKEKFHGKIAPFLAQYDKALNYLQERRKLYEQGQLPKEDQQLRTLILQVVRLAKEVENEQFYSERSQKVRFDEIIPNQSARKMLRRGKPFDRLDVDKRIQQLECSLDSNNAEGSASTPSNYTQPKQQFGRAGQNRPHAETLQSERLSTPDQIENPGPNFEKTTDRRKRVSLMDEDRHPPIIFDDSGEKCSQNISGFKFQESRRSYKRPTHSKVARQKERAGYNSGAISSRRSQASQMMSGIKVSQLELSQSESFFIDGGPK